MSSLNKRNYPAIGVILVIVSLFIILLPIYNVNAQIPNSTSPSPGKETPNPSPSPGKETPNPSPSPGNETPNPSPSPGNETPNPSPQVSVGMILVAIVAIVIIALIIFGLYKVAQKIRNRGRTKPNGPIVDVDVEGGLD